MKKFLTVLAGIMTVLSFVACSVPVLDGNSGNPGNPGQYGSIVGKAVYSNAEDNSGIIVSIEKTDGVKTAAVSKTVADGTKIIAKSVLNYRTTNADGEYSFTNLAEGTYTIYASSNNSSEKAIFTNVVVTAGKSVTVEELKLTATGSITGNITIDKKSTGNAGFLVFVAGTSYMAITDDAGNYTISSVPAGSKYQVIVSKGELLFTLDKDVTVSSNASAAMNEAYLDSISKVAYGKKDDSWVKLSDEASAPTTGGVPCASTLYVRQTGNDQTGEGTREKPYKTILKAYEEIEKTLDEEKTYTIKLLSDLENHVCVDVQPSFNLKLVIESDGNNSFTVKGWGSDGLRHNENYKYNKFYIVDGVLQDDYDETDEIRDKALGKKVYRNEIMAVNYRGDVVIKNINFSDFMKGFNIGWNSKNDCDGKITLKNVEIKNIMDTFFSGANGTFVFDDVRLSETLNYYSTFLTNKVNITVKKMEHPGTSCMFVLAARRLEYEPWQGKLIIEDGIFGNNAEFVCSVIYTESNSFTGIIEDDSQKGDVIINGGTFNGSIYSESSMTRIKINGGTFNNSVETNSSTLITGGTFNSNVVLKKNTYPYAIHKITGGTFKDYSSIGAYFDWSDLTDLSVIRGKKFISPEAYNQTSDYDMYYAVKISDDASGYNGSYSGTLYDYSKKSGIETDWESIKAAKMASSTTDLEFDDANYKMISWPKSETAPDYVRSMECKISEDKATILFCVDGNYYIGVLVQ